MKVLYSEDEFQGKASVVALGMFDGVHIGHQKLIRTAVSLARGWEIPSVVCTFDRHPLEVLCPERAPERLLSLEENLKKFERLGADFALVKTFTSAFAAELPEDFLEFLADMLKVKAIVAGENYTFGRAGCGNAEMLRRYETKFGYRAVIVPPVMDGERMASSTYVRELLRRGEIEHAAKLMKMDHSES